MIRRSFRVVLRLALLAGAGFAILKVIQSRRPAELAPPPSRDPWPPVPAPSPPPDAVAQAVEQAPEAAPEAAPAAPAAQPAKKAVKASTAVKKATKATKAVKKAAQGWVEPENGECPPSHEIKAKLSSMIYHLPGMANYARTRPDRCYASEAAAKRDGFSAAKR